MKLTCDQFELLMEFYIEDKLKSGLKQLFEGHLMTCKFCRYKFNIFHNIIKDLQKSYKTISQNLKFQSSDFDRSSNSLLNSKMSAYIDNELNTKENIKIRKMIMTRNDMRGKIEKLYKLRELLMMSFNKIILKRDYSSQVIKNIFINNTKKNTGFRFYFILIVLTILLLCVIFKLYLFYS